MKVSWSEEDITMGRVIQKVDCGVTGSWMIGYRRDCFDGSIGTKQTYGIVSLADGMFMDLGSKSDVVNYLNEHKELLPIELTNVIIEFGNPDEA